jgi:orotate phosphoribosyltransferase
LQPYQEKLASLLAASGSLFFADGLRLKDGRPTPYFVNLGLFRTGRLALELGRCFAQWLANSGLADEPLVLLGPSYKGSAIAQGAAIALYQEHGIDLEFDYDRKEAKTHGEATKKGAMFVTGALTPGCRVLIIDDVGTSMATKLELLEKLEEEGQRQGKPFELAGVSLAVDREQTQAVYDEAGQVVLGVKGDDALGAFTARTGLPVWSLLGIRQAVQILHASGEPVTVDGQRRPIDDELLARVNDYLAVYGREG